MRVFRLKRRVAVSAAVLIAAALGSFACGGGGDGGITNPPDTTTPKAISVSFTGGTVKAEMAATGAQRSTGLSGRTSIAADSGMLFIFGTDRTPQGCGFWMQNTHFDLDIAFLASDKRVINIDTMTKETLDVHTPTANCRYALEAPKGWFASHGVTAGALATFAIPAGVIIDP
jgi:uncharacterized membrane protein (UPF0127 family)